MAEWREFLLVVAVLGLVLAAAALCTPKGRAPLALRGIQKILRRDRGVKPGNKVEPVPVWRKWLAFLMVLVAFLLAFA